MSFLAPDNLIWAVVAVLVLLLYVVRIGGRQQKIASYLLWQRALARRSGWSRWWQRWVSLAVALAFAALLVLALMRPFSSDAVQRARHVVLVIDTSASMNATDVEPSRLAVAKTQARQIVDRLEPHERAAVVSAGARIDVLCGFSKDADRIRAAVGGVRAGEGPTRIVEAVALARQMVALRKKPQVIVLTDAAFDAVSELPDDENLKLVIVAGQPENVGITRLAMRPHASAESPQRDLLVEVANAGSQAVECTLNTQLATGNGDDPDRAAGVESKLEIPAGGSTTTIVALDAGPADLVTVQLKQEDDLAADNRAQLLVPALRSQRVLLVAGAESPVAVAVRSLSHAKVARVEALPPRPGPQTVTVFHGRVPDVLPPGPTLVIEPDASCDLWELDDAAGVAHRVQGRVAHVRESPLLAGVDLSRVVMEEKVALAVTGEFEPLVTDESDQPLYALIPRPDGAGPVLVFTARLSKSKSDLTLRPDFPLLLANAVHWLGGAARPVYAAANTADVILMSASPEVRALVSPDGRSAEFPADQSMVGPLARGGLWSVVTASAAPARPAALASAGRSDVEPDEAELEDEKAGLSVMWQGAKARGIPPDSLIAVSLVDADESDLRTRPDAAGVELESLLGGGPSRPWWVWLVALAVVVCLAEWCLYHRRVLV